METERNLAHLVQQDRASIGQLESPVSLVSRSGERAFFVPEKLALDESFRNGRAVHLNERLAAAIACKKNFIGDEFFTSPIFTTDHHRGIRSADPIDQIPKLNDDWAFTDDLSVGNGRPIEIIRHLCSTLEFRSLLQNQIDLHFGEGLLDVIKRPRAHTLDHRLDRPVGRDHHHQWLVLQMRHPLDKDLPVAIRKLHIQKHKIEVAGRKSFLRLSQRSGRRHSIPLASELFLEGFSNDRGVINHQYAIKRHYFKTYHDTCPFLVMPIKVYLIAPPSEPRCRQNLTETNESSVDTLFL